MNVRNSRILTQGMVAGGIGYLAVAAFMLAADLLQGHAAFHTPALLGNLFFYGLQDPSGSRIWPGPVFAYNGLHLVLFLGLGLMMAWLADLSERGPQFWYIALTLYLVVIFHMVAFAFGATQRLGPSFSPWIALGAGVFAAVAMATYLLRAHPALRRELRTYHEAT